MTALRKALNVLLWFLLGAVAVLAVAIIVLPRALGWVPLTILSGSMEPTIPTGSQVVVAPIEGEADAARLQVGDVAAFMPRPEDPTLVTHRIVGESVTADGSVSFTTRGDANDTVDPWQVTATQLRGEVRYHVPYAGYVATALDGHQKSVGVGVVAVALFAYAAGQLVAAGREMRRRRAGVGTGEDTARSDLGLKA